MNRPAPLVLLTALSMSIGWGIRGQFGHEYGAAMAGVLGAIAVALWSGREDWWRRVHFFALLGGIGWAFGGSMSYMKVVAYTHSPEPSSVAYGFAGLFVIGFLWAAPGGFGCALPAFWNRAVLTRGCGPLLAVFGAWFVQEIYVDWHGNILHGPSLAWFDSDWLGASSALAAALACAVVRKGMDEMTWLIVHMAAGWWAGFLLLTVLGGLHMTPPRGDNWAGCVGLVAGLLLYCRRYRLGGVAYATVATGLLGGAGYSAAQIFKLAVISTGVQTNWHSILEQSQGFLLGAALAAAMLHLVRHAAPPQEDEPHARRWADAFAVFFVVVLVTYVNFRKSPNDWIQQIPTFREWMYGLRATGWFLPSRGWIGWFDLAYIAFALAVVFALRVHLRRGLALIPSNWLGRGQLLYLIFLWAIVFINFAHVLGRFAPQRLITEWLVAIHAAIATAFVIAAPPARALLEQQPADWNAAMRRITALGVAAAVLVVAAGWFAKPLLLGDAHTGAGLAIRFGPNANNDAK